MHALTRGIRLARIGVTTLAVAAIAVGGYAASAAAAPVTAARQATVTGATVRASAAQVTAPARQGRYIPPKRTLREGMRGADVKAMQRRLKSLKYYPGPIDGQFGPDTEEAVWAFQEVNKIKVTGTINAVTKGRLVHPHAYKARYPHHAGNRVEVNLAERVLVVYRHHRIVLISHVSSGGGYRFCDAHGCSRAVTPAGSYRTTGYLPGWVKVPLGAMYNPVFFIGYAYAIHGDTFVPVYPASHGCVRLPMDIAAFFHKLVAHHGEQVLIYGKPHYVL